MLPGLNLCSTDPAQHIITAGGELDDLQQIMIYLICLSEVCTIDTMIAKSVHQHKHHHAARDPAPTTATPGKAIHLPPIVIYLV